MTSSQVSRTRKAAKDAIAHPPEPPPHLSEKMKKFWRGVFQLQNPQPFEILILTQACQAHDRAEQARRLLKTEGLIFEDKWGKPKARPEVLIEINSQALFAKLLKQIHLNNEYWEYLGDD